MILKREFSELLNGSRQTCNYYQLERTRNLTPEQRAFFDQLREVYQSVDDEFLAQLDRSVSFGDMVADRWERARKLGFGENSSIYDSSLVIGKVKIGANCWIGPYTILDGSGGLEIGDYTTISAGVHIYSHDNIMATLSSGRIPIQRSGVHIGHNTYIAPNAVVTKGINIGNYVVVSAGSLVNRSVEDYSIVGGSPAKAIGRVEPSDDQFRLIMNHR